MKTTWHQKCQKGKLDFYYIGLSLDWCFLFLYSTVQRY